MRVQKEEKGKEKKQDFSVFIQRLLHSVVVNNVRKKGVNTSGVLDFSHFI